MENKNDFSKGSVTGNILRLAGPMTLAQLIDPQGVEAFEKLHGLHQNE